MKVKKNIFGILKYTGITLVALLYLFPFLFLLLNSLKGKIEILKEPLALPQALDFSNYARAAEQMNYFSSLKNSLIITVSGVVIITVFSSMLAYYLARIQTKLNKFIFYSLIVAMIIPFQALMVPFVSIYGRLHLLNSRVALVYFYLGFAVSLSTFMYHGFISKLSIFLDESAALEGASRFVVFWKIIFPQLRPITATVVVLNVLWFWNDYLLPSLVLFKDNRTLPLATYSFFGQFTTEYGLAMAGLVLSIFPVIIFYLLMQKQIIGGITDGAVK